MSAGAGGGSGVPEAPRLKSVICYCSSEEDSFPVDELQKDPKTFPTPGTVRGWQSQRMCTFPQEIVLRFESEVELQQIQILAHECKVPSKIGVFISGELDRSVDYSRVTFKKLGNVTFIGNRKGGKAYSRELKTVHLNNRATFLKLLIHECQPDQLNLYNQVGIISLGCFGVPCGPKWTRSLPPLAANAPPQPPSTAAFVGPACADAFTAFVAWHVKDLGIKKNDAMETEDFDEAKRLKAVITHLESALNRVRQLDAEKRAAMVEEEFDRAKAAKVELERFCRDASRGLEKPTHQHATAVLKDHVSAAPEIRHEPPELDETVATPGRHHHVHEHQAEHRERERYQAQPQHAQPVSFDDKPIPSRFARMMAESGPSSAAQAYSVPPPGTADIQGQSDPFNTNVDAIQPEEAFNFDALPQWELEIRDAIHQEAGDEVSAEVLPRIREADTEPYTTMFGQYATACLFSRRHQLREATLRTFNSFLLQLYPDADPTAVVSHVLRYLDLRNYGVLDPVASVFLVATDFLRRVVDEQFEGVALPSVTPALLSVLPHVVTRCADPEKAVADEAFTLLSRVGSTSVGYERVVGAILNEPLDPPGKRFTPNSHKQRLKRIEVVQHLMDEDGQNSREVNVDSVISKLIVPCLQYAHAPVQEAALSLCLSIGNEYRASIERNLRGVPQIQTEIICKHFDLAVPAHEPPKRAKPHRSSPQPHVRKGH